MDLENSTTPTWFGFGDSAFMIMTKLFFMSTWMCCHSWMSGFVQGYGSSLSLHNTPVEVEHFHLSNCFLRSNTFCEVLVQEFSWWEKPLKKYEQFRVQLWKKIHVGLISEFDFQDLTLHLLGTLASMHAVRVPGKSSGRRHFSLVEDSVNVGMLSIQLWIINDILIQQFVGKTDIQRYVEFRMYIHDVFLRFDTFWGIEIHEEAIPTFENDPIIFKPSSNDFVFKTKPRIGVATNAGLDLGAWGATCKGGGALPAATVTLRLKWKSFGATCLVRNYVWIVLQYLRWILKKHKVNYKCLSNCISISYIYLFVSIYIAIRNPSRLSQSIKAASGHASSHFFRSKEGGQMGWAGLSCHDLLE